jgi:hypothetical protein
MTVSSELKQVSKMEEAVPLVPKDDHTSQRNSNKCADIYPWVITSVLGFLGMLAFLAMIVITIIAVASSSSNRIVVINDYNDCDVVAAWVVMMPNYRTSAQETTLMPGQSDSYPSKENRRVVMITTKIYLDNNKWVYTEFEIPSQVYDATYTISQLRGPQSNITSTTGMLNVTTND